MKRTEMLAKAKEVAGDEFDPAHVIQLVDMIGAYERSAQAFALFCKAFELSVEYTSPGLPSDAQAALADQVKALNNSETHGDLSDLDESVWNCLDNT